ncbi:hypothetical protein C2G38_2118491 [Gigaspora rosea]|uniref:Uncharacterized protein n=1 Tax=Gigaspora rosea TaxID=44941 RepID=A0A397U8K9_9GLOM|nr:hypothetical protein C2G38_2118491 [Gigaspora rosea]
MFYNNNRQINECYTYHNNAYERQIDIGSSNTKIYYFVNEYKVFQIYKKSTVIPPYSQTTKLINDVYYKK